MPRIARIKSEQSIYHIIVKSISEVKLFKDNKDKDRYLEYIKKYQEMFNFKLYVFCLMDNHAHFIIDANGADISKIMHGINQSYAQYFNRKYSRHGHLFQDRFKSIIVNSERQFITLTLYIHNNTKDLMGKIKSIDEYIYSSLGVYLGKFDDRFKILDTSFLISQFRLNYVKFVSHYKYMMKMSGNENVRNDIQQYMYEGTEYRSERKILTRKIDIDFIVSALAQHAGIEESFLNIKYSHSITELRAVSVFLLRHFCNLRQKEICDLIGNITQSRVSALGAQGIKFIMKGRKYEDIIRRISEISEATSVLDG